MPPDLANIQKMLGFLKFKIEDCLSLPGEGKSEIEIEMERVARRVFREESAKSPPSNAGKDRRASS